MKNKHVSIRSIRIRNYREIDELNVEFPVMALSKKK